MLEFAKVVTYISIFSAVLPLLLLMIKWRHHRRCFVLLGVLIIISFAADIFSIAGIALQPAASYWLNIQDMLQFILLTLVEFYLKDKQSILIVMIVSYFLFEKLPLFHRDLFHRFIRTIF